MAVKSSSSPIKVIYENRKARHEYTIHDTLECGIKLIGCEIKSIRTAKCSLDGSYVSTEGNQLMLLESYIEPYKNAGYTIQEPRRPRLLLAHKREIRKLKLQVSAKGNTLIPLRLYLKNGLAKIEIAVCTGKKLYDKRQAEKTKQFKRDVKNFKGQS